MTSTKNKTVAITGAASGIGRALAIALAREGCHLALADRDLPGLEETRRLIQDLPPSSRLSRAISLHPLDVADRQQVYRWADAVIQQHGEVDIVINNAGVASSGSIEKITIEDFNWVFDIVFYGVLYGTKAFLPHLRQVSEGHLVNISSVNAFFPFPNNGPYNCAKHAVKALNQTLMQELRGSNVKVTSVHPGGIKTNIVNNSRFLDDSLTEADRQQARDTFNRIARTTPEQAAKVIIKGINSNKRRLLVGFDAYLIDWLCRLFPQSFADYVGRADIKALQQADTSAPK